MLYRISLVRVMGEECAVTLHCYALLDTCSNSTVLLQHLLGDVSSLLDLLTSLLDGIDAVRNKEHPCIRMLLPLKMER